MKDGRTSTLVIKLSSIGDCIHCSAAVRRLREARPEDHIVWLVGAKSRAVVEGMPFVDEVLVYERDVPSVTKVPGGFLAARRALAPHRFDIAFDFQGLGRSALILLASGASTRVAYLDGRECSPVAATTAWVPRGDHPWVVDRYIDLLEAVGIPYRPTGCHVPVSDESAERAARFLREAGAEDAPLLGLALRGSWPSKFWPAERFALVARRAHERWGLTAVLLGGPDDRSDADEVLARAQSPMLDLVGALPLGASMAVVGRCKTLIGPDTGMIYASMAMDVPTVSLFGPTEPEAVAPRGPHTRTIYHPMPCAPCYRKPTCGGRFDCVQAIGVDEVFEALVELLG